MRPTIFFILFYFISFILCSSGTYYVSINTGSSYNTGTENNPFSSINDALNAVKVNNNSKVTINIFPGFYSDDDNIGLIYNLPTIINLVQPPYSPESTNFRFQCSGVFSTGFIALNSFEINSLDGELSYIRYCSVALQVNDGKVTSRGISFISNQNAIIGNAVSEIYLSDTSITGTSLNSVGISATAGSQIENLAPFVEIFDSIIDFATVSLTGFSFGIVENTRITDMYSEQSPFSIVSGNWKFFNSYINNCTSSSSGGAISASYCDELSVRSCSFIDCSSNVNGGAINTYYSTLKVELSSFNGCSATQYGGAVYLNTGENEFKNSNFTYCSAQIGGGVDLEGSVLESDFDGVTFTNNSANNGSCISCCQIQKIGGCDTYIENNGITASENTGNEYACHIANQYN